MAYVFNGAHVPVNPEGEEGNNAVHCCCKNTRFQKAQPWHQKESGSERAHDRTERVNTVEHSRLESVYLALAGVGAHHNGERHTHERCGRQHEGKYQQEPRQEKHPCPGFKRLVKCLKHRLSSPEDGNGKCAANRNGTLNKRVSPNRVFHLLRVNARQGASYSQPRHECGNDCSNGIKTVAENVA